MCRNRKRLCLLGKRQEIHTKQVSHKLLLLLLVLFYFSRRMLDKVRTGILCIKPSFELKWTHYDFSFHCNIRQFPYSFLFTVRNCLCPARLILQLYLQNLGNSIVSTYIKSAFYRSIDTNAFILAKTGTMTIVLEVQFSIFNISQTTK
jgi:hypothetical protein